MNSVCDRCGKEFFKDEGTVMSGFGICNSCIGVDHTSINEVSKENMVYIEEEFFSDHEYMTNLNSLTIKELIDLKDRYDRDFIKYWSSRGGSPKFNPVSLKEFVERLRNRNFFDKFGKGKT